MALSPGDQLGPYVILSLIGEGGMGEVYKARDTRLDRVVALKLLPVEMAAVPDRRRRFVQEAKAASALNHPNIAHIYEIGEHGERLYLAMEFVEGETLHDRIASKPLLAREVIEFGTQIAAALAEAHTKRIVHRDIKPANVMITPQGIVKVLDFGLAKVVAPPPKADDPTVMRTTSGMVMGTVDYMSPEQSRGAEVDHRTDIYSFGLVLHEMATGKLPEALSGGNTGLPRGLAPILQRCLERDLEKRWPTASEVGRELQAAGAAAPSATGTRRWWLGAAATGVLAGIGSAAWITLRPGEVIDSVAVLPLTNSGGNADMEYLGEGIAQSLINSLSQLPGLKVKSLVSVAKLKGKIVEPQELGKSLAVRAVVTGSVLQRGDDLAIAVQLVDARTGDQIWGERYDRKVANILVMQEEMAREIAGRLRQKLSGGQKKKAGTTENSEAYQAYLKGRHYSNKRTEEGIRKSMEFFNQAIERDPGYALSYVGLADANILAVRYAAVPSRERMARAKALLRKALEIDDSLPEAYASLGYIKGPFDFDWRGSEDAFLRCITLNPNYALARLWYATVYLNVFARFEEAEKELRRAIELEPLTPIMTTNLGRMFYYRRHWDSAIEELKKTLELDPTFAEAIVWLGRSYFAKGMLAEGIETLRTGRRVRGSSTDLGSLGLAVALNGGLDEARSVLAELKLLASFNPHDAALIHTGLGQKTAALDWLDKAFENRWAMISTINVDPAFDSLRAEPRFQALVKKMGLVPAA